MLVNVKGHNPQGSVTCGHLTQRRVRMLPFLLCPPVIAFLPTQQHLESDVNVSSFYSFPRAKQTSAVKGFTPQKHPPYNSFSLAMSHFTVISTDIFRGVKRFICQQHAGKKTPHQKKEITLYCQYTEI